MRITDHLAERVKVVLATAAWFGLLMQFCLFFQDASEHGRPVSSAWTVFTGFFTIFTNLFIALSFTLPSKGAKYPALAWLYRSSVRGCAVTAAMLVAIAYHFLLRKLWAPEGAQWIADIILHYLVPALALFHWAVTRHHEILSWNLPPRWCSYPFIFLGYAMIRGEILKTYPYPFIDVNAIGYAKAIMNAAGLILGYLMLGYLVLWISRQRCGFDRRSIAE